MARKEAAVTGSASTASAPPAPGRASLTQRDLETLHLLAAGRSTARIAAAMSLSTNTVRSRVRRLQRTVGAPARDQVVLLARERGLLPCPDDAARPALGSIPRQRAAVPDAERARASAGPA